MKLIDSIPWLLVIVACASLGLAPFSPEPHVWEKLKMLAAGNLTQSMDMFDLLIHGSPWVLLVLKLTRYSKTK